MTTRSNILASILVALVLVFGTGLQLVASNEGTTTGSEEGGSSREQWEALAPEEQEKLRDALREVWTDPDVIAAREDVRRASEAYQQAIRDAVGKTDPSISGLVTRVQQETSRKMGERMGGGPGGKFGQRRTGSYPMGPPGFVESLSPEERKKFQAAEKKAQSAPRVQEARKVFESIRKQDEALRSRRMEAHRRMRTALLETIVEEDPTLKQIVAKLAARAGETAGGKGFRGSKSKEGEGGKGKSGSGSSPKPDQDKSATE